MYDKKSESYNVLNTLKNFAGATAASILIAAGSINAADSTAVATSATKQEIQSIIAKANDQDSAKITKKSEKKSESKKEEAKKESVILPKMKKFFEGKESTINTKINFLDAGNQFHETSVGLRSPTAYLGLSVGTALYNQNEKQEGTQAGMNFTNKEESDLSGKTFGLETELKIKESNLGFSIMHGSDNMKINSDFASDYVIRQGINDYNVTDSIKTNETRKAEIENSSMLTKFGPSKQFTKTIRAGSNFGIISNRSSNTEKVQTIDKIIEELRQDTLTGVRDTSILLSRDTLSPETTIVEYKLENKERIFIINPYATANIGKAIVRADYMINVKETKLKQDTLDERTLPDQNYSLAALQVGFGNNKIFSKTLLGTSISENGRWNPNNVRFIQALYISRGGMPANNLLEQMKETKENQMVIENERRSMAITTLESMGTLNETNNTLALTNRYKIFEANPEINQILFGYERIYRDNATGWLGQMGLNVLLANINNGTVNFVWEAALLNLNGQSYKMFSPAIMGSYKAIEGTLGATVSKSGRESATSLNAIIKVRI